MPCPLCEGAHFEPSWFGSVLFEGTRYGYVRCVDCGSSFCEPMPSDATFARMYGPAYAEAGDPDPGVTDPKEPERILAWLARREPGVFVDFGCGSGSLLLSAGRLGWTPVGVEFDAEVTRRTEDHAGHPVLQGLRGLRASKWVPADVIHLGDVIEHLPAPLLILRELERLLKPGGLLLAQGPLEAGPCLFTAVLRLARRARSRPATQMPPYHVLQATVEGQRRLFGKLETEEIEYSLSEASWPATDCFRAKDVRHPKTLALFLLRRVSQAVSSLQPKRWGNRYVYAGRRAATRGSGDGD